MERESTTDTGDQQQAADIPSPESNEALQPRPKPAIVNQRGEVVGGDGETKVRKPDFQDRYGNKRTDI